MPELPALPASEIWLKIHEERLNGVPALWLNVIVDIFITLRDGSAGDARVALDFMLEDDGVFDLASLNLGFEPGSLRSRIFNALSKQGSRCPGLHNLLSDLTKDHHHMCVKR